MNQEKIISFADKIIEFSFYALFFLVPLVLTPVNYELFEYNKMMLTYGLTFIIIAAWITKMVCQKEAKIARTPFDLPLLLFFASQVISTILSIDRHTSIWGYYSRSHGGLLSTIAYISLYYAFVTNISRQKIKSLIYVILVSGMLVSIYGVLEHFGIDKDVWVQDVQARVFSTLGQPNWLAAYLAVLIPIAVGMGQNYVERHSGKFASWRTHPESDSGQVYTERSERARMTQNDSGRTSFARMTLITWKSIVFFSLSALFYLTLLYTRSRSGFLAIWASLTALVIILKLPKSLPSSPIGYGGVNKELKLAKPALFVTGIFLVISFINGIPFLQFNKFLLPGILNPKAVQNEPLPKGAALDTGVTESGEIRKIVWQGAIDIIKANPLFGTGTETFAYSYYKFRPQAHNMVSEWDFLYNKAHNEYLNFGANNGLFGLGTYLLFIGGFMWWFFKSFRSRAESRERNLGRLGRPQNDATARSLTANWRFGMTNDDNFLLIAGLFTGWLSILITNFFGFSVVIIGLLFFLIPAISLVLSGELADKKMLVLKFATSPTTNDQRLKTKDHFPIVQKVLIASCILLAVYFLLTLFRFWLADKSYATGYNLNHANEPTTAFDHLRQAVSLNPKEPLYHDELATNLATLAVLAFNQKEATLTASLIESSISESDKALLISPNNVNIYKSRTRLYYTLSQIDPKYNEDALASIIKALELAPTDAKIRYNLALLYGRTGDSQKAIETLKDTIKLKPNYTDAYYALALYYKDAKEDQMAQDALKFILDKIDPANSDARKKLDEWTNIKGASESSESSGKKLSP